ncbi:MAG: MFS transporter [Pirellulaceae bacterium]
MLIESANPNSEQQSHRRSSPPAEDRPTYVRYVVLAMVCSLSMITYLDRVCFGSAAPEIAEALSLGGVSDLKWAFTAFALAYAIFEIPSGWLGDRWGPRGVLIRIVTWWSVCTILTGMIGLRFAGITLGGLGSLIVLRFLFGAGEAGAYPNITRTIHNWFPPTQWEHAQGMIWMTGRLMGGLTPLLWAILVGTGAFSLPLLSWRGAFYLFGGIGLIWCFGFALWFRNRPSEHPGVSQAEQALIGSRTHHGESHGGIPWRNLLASRSLLALCLMYALVTFVWIFNITYLPSYLQERFAIPKGDMLGAIYGGAPLWVGAIGCLAGGSVVSYLARRSGDRRRARRVLGVGAMALCSGFWIGALYSPNIHVFCILVAASAFCIDLTIGSAWATCQDLGQRHAGVTAASMNMVGTFGAALAGWLTGTLIETSVAARAAVLQVTVEQLPLLEKHAAVLHGYDWLFMINVGVFVTAAVCWCFIDASKPIVPETTPSMAE